MPYYPPAVPANVILPTDHGLLGWSIPPEQTASTSVLTSGTISMTRIPWRTTATISNIIIVVGVAGATLTSAQNLAGIYNSAGTRLGLTADQSTSWTSTGLKTMALTSSVSVPGSTTGYIWVALMSNGTTPIAPARANQTATAAGMNVGLAASATRFATGPTAQTSLPASITTSSLAQINNPFFVAVS